jgi:MFS family permease
MTHSIHGNKRWLALIVLCLGVLMIVLDTTIVNVALPSIAADLGFTETSLVWVVNAYMLTFGGCLLLGGRLGDLYGHRKLFLIGITLFTLASLACGISNSQGLLVCARAVQGVAGAIVSAVSLSLIMNLFTEPGERAKAMGVYGFVCAGGGSIGVLLGGLLTNLLSWHWIFLVNLPIGIAVYALCVALLPSARGHAHGERLDVAGAVSVTVSLMLAVYAVVNGNEAGWTSAQTLGLLFVALALLVVFLDDRSARSASIDAAWSVPLAQCRDRERGRRVVGGGDVCLVLHLCAVFAACAWLSAVAGRACVPAGQSHHGILFARAVGARGDALWSTASAGRRSAGRGVRSCVVRSRAGGRQLHVLDVMPGMILLGFGAGIAFNPMLLAAMSDVDPSDSGLASGIVNTSFMMGGALGLAVLASLAAARSEAMQASGDAVAALNSGYHVAFLFGAIFAAVAGVLGGAVVAAGARGLRLGRMEGALTVHNVTAADVHTPEGGHWLQQSRDRKLLNAPPLHRVQNRNPDQTSRIGARYAGSMLT